MTPSVADLRMAAMLHDTIRGRPRIREMLTKYGANKISEVPETHRAECLLEFLRLKMQAKHDYWEMTT